MSYAVSFAEIDGQCVDLLPARIVLSAHGGADGDLTGGDGGHGGAGGDYNTGGEGKGGDSGDATAVVAGNYNIGDHNIGAVTQANTAVAVTGDGGDGYGGDAGTGGYGGAGGDAEEGK